MYQASTAILLYLSRTETYFGSISYDLVYYGIAEKKFLMELVTILSIGTGI